ncbi:MAG TPA: ChrR family anti-sigma-E factor [Reyranella sp.]|nr:ChrR family anti-sigma-E factor [Reyranella sp.]
MSRHPAPEELLLDYAAGNLPEGPALAVALQVALDPGVRRTVERLRDVGGALLDQSAAAALDEGALERTLSRLDAAPVEGPAPPARQPGFDWAPVALAHYLPAGARWKRVFGGFEQIDVPLRADTHRAALLRLAPGQGLPVHRHVANEYTVVLQGGYTDNTGNYVAGDFAIGPGPHAHQPIADPGDPCIALIVLEKPIVLTGAAGLFLNPLLRWGWL